MSLADELLNDLDGLSDGEEEEQTGPTQSIGAGPSSSSNGGGGGGGFGLMLPPPIPSASGSGSGKRKAIDDDLEGLDGEGEGDDGDDDMEGLLSNSNGGGVSAGYVPTGGVRPAEELDREEVEGMNLKGVEDVESVVKLQKSKKLGDALEKIAYYTANPTDTSPESGPIEENPEYALIVTSNNLSVEVENELLLVHKFIRDHYNPRFPELEQVIGDPWEYIIAVQSIGNAPDLTKPPTPIAQKHSLGVSMTASMSRGKILEPSQWLVVEKACKVAWELREAREKIFAYVESRMNILAPNISAIIGTTIAAKLLGVAGGLAAFAKTPSCNVFLFGAVKKNVSHSHLSAAGQQRHTGFIFQSPIVQASPAEYRKKAQRTVAGKVSLAARVDLERNSRDGSYGKDQHDKVLAHLAKMAEPPPSKLVKALPIPIETNRKKRGGKRARKAKEAYATTELRKLQNRMAFGEAEEETGAYDETVGLGMIGSANGRVRAEIADSRSKAKLSKANKLRTQMLGRAAASSNSGLSGTSTSLSFTPVQGIEIVTPSLAAAQRVQAANDRWFAQGTFTHVPKQKSTIPGQDSNGAGPSK